MKKIILLIACCVFGLTAFDVLSQKSKNQKSTPPTVDPAVYEGLEWRNIGPFRGGRSAAVTGVPGKPNLYYMGATGGGVWRTMDGGNTWENISDGYFGGSIGAVAVSEWDNNVIYVGGGEKTVRGNVSYGYGMYKSVDAGKTWKHIGLSNSRHIPRVKIHPKNPDLVYAAVLGDLYKSAEERGVYRSKDGGASWERILFANADAGAIDLVMDPTNPRVLYATTWRVRRTPYSLESGGEGSALWKSTDGGDNWVNISKNEGLPKGVWGIAGVTVSPVNAQRVWCIIENEDGGVFRSEDAGKTWKLVNKERSLRQRAWYYTRIYADTQDEDMVHVLNVSYHQSKDGGRTFETVRTPHGDHHDLWIAPEDQQRMVIGDDGGAQVTFDGGANWSTYHNQPTAQFYRVVTDNDFPYRIYGAQQDNSTLRIRHRVGGGYIEERDWEETAGSESAHLAVDPKNSDLVYGGSYGGFLTRLNHANDQQRAVNVWPDNPMGHGAEGATYRFQWNFPIFFSAHNNQRLYAASQHLHMTEDGGQSWKTISPDLTRNDPTKMKSSGGPITKDNTSVEYYCTIFAATESIHEEGVIWAGSDDGLIHLTRDGGEKWVNVTPANIPEWTMINSIEIDPFNKGGAYVAGTRYKLGDYAPYLYKTSDYGASWTKITNGIPSDHFTRVLKADPVKQGILYAGTESGMYVSFNDGARWQPLQMNLPIVPITDLTIKNNNLIAATQGRSFWLIDDLTVLHQMEALVEDKQYHLFQPMDSYRMGGGNGRTSLTAGTDHPGGVLVHFLVRDTVASDTLRLGFYSQSGDLITSFSTHPDKAKKERQLEVKPGLNRMNWDMRYEGAKTFDGMILWWATTNGPLAVPGAYQVRLSVNGETQQQDFNLLQDPRNESTIEDLQSQFDYLMAVRDKLSETHEAILDIRNIRDQIKMVLDRTDHEQLQTNAKEILKELKLVEEALYQTKNESRQDPLNYPIRLNNKLAHLSSLNGMGDYAPTSQSIAFLEEVSTAIDQELAKLKTIKEEQIPSFNQMVKEAEVDAVKLD